MASPTLTTCGVCGLYCEACPLFLGSTDDAALLESFCKRSGKSREEATCHGCRSDALSWHCRSCKLKACAQEKGLAFCAHCPEFPCAKFRRFADGDLEDPLVAGKRPHRMEVMQDCQTIKEMGWQAWSLRMVVDYSCAACGTINSAYNVRCRKCGSVPGNAFVGRNQEAILKFLKP
jgi:hypothetical protein